MGNYLNIGNDGFQSIIKGRYVDKTGLISFVNSKLGTSGKLICVSRPRRFGKSYAAKMLSAYYDKSCDSRMLFANYKIAQDPSFETYLNKYNVIYLDITLFTGDVLNAVDNIRKKLIEELRAAFPDISRSEALHETLSNIADSIHEKFVVIIDEWDALFREAQDNIKVQKEYIQLIRSLFKSNLTDKFIDAVYMTGILPIKKYGTQSAMTDFNEYTMTQPEPIEEFVGFTEDEVRSLCETSKLNFEDFKKWYDGYVLGNNIHIYSPKSVIDAIERNRLGNYWTQSETYESLQIYIDLDMDGLKEAVVQMLGGAHIRIDVATFQNDMTNIKSKDDVLTLLVHLGYLTYDIEEKSVYIPNEEVREEFVRAVSGGRHVEVAKCIRNAERLLDETVNMNEEAVAAAFEEAHRMGTDPMHYNDEQALRSVIRFAYLTCVDEFVRIDEMPGGRGYADVVFLPKKGSSMPVMIIELKWNRSAESAIQQIKKNSYPKNLEGYGGRILMVGINYDSKTQKHTCRIEEYFK